MASAKLKGQVKSNQVNHLTNLIKPIQANWEILGMALKVPAGKLANIKANPNLAKSDFCLNEVIVKFGKAQGKTWQDIYDAVVDMDRNDIASEIEDKYKLSDTLPYDSSGEILAKDIIDVVSKVAANWQEFGGNLGIEFNDLQTMKREANTVRDCSFAMISTWVAHAAKEATIETFIDAIRSPLIENEFLAQQIEQDPRLNKWFQGQTKTQTDPVPVALVDDTC